MFFAVACPIYVSNSHTKFGWIAFNCKGEDSITNCDDARKCFLFSKVLLVYLSLQINLDGGALQRRIA